MKLLIIGAVFAVLFFLYWLTSKDRTLKGMVGSIVADFESNEPNPLAPKEGFRGGYGGHGGHSTGRGGYYHGGRGGSGGGGTGWGWWWPFPLAWPIWYDTEYVEYVPSYAIGV